MEYLCKNPAYVYKKDLDLNSALQNLKAYNHATNNPKDEHNNNNNKETFLQSNSRHCKRPRIIINSPPPPEEEDTTDGGPMSHYDYILKIRKETANSTQPGGKLSTDDDHVWDRSGQRLISDQHHPDPASIQDIHQQNKDTNIAAGNKNNADHVKETSEQRFPVPGEPVCVVCGKYGEYICDETDDDICSIDCKAQLLDNLKNFQPPSSSQNIVEASSERIFPSQVYESGGDTWDFNRHRWSTKRSNLCTYECWKCKNAGHLAEDCLVASSSVSGSSRIPKDLLELYKRCHQIGKKSAAAKCNACHRSTTLATCLDCKVSFCDSAGHLVEHIQTHPSHTKYYSYKLNRLVKCCKSTCKVTGIKDLLVCHFCFDKAFEKFYDMHNATWKASGISIIAGSICCEDHFTWHRINCLNAGVEDGAYIFKRQIVNEKRSQLYDFIF